MALWAASVKIDGHISFVKLAVQGRERGCRHDSVKASLELGERRPLSPRCEDALVTGKAGCERPVRGHAREEVAQSERPQDDEPGLVLHGQDGSLEGVTTSSRTSHPGGWERANATVSATCCGSFSCASSGGL